MGEFCFHSVAWTLSALLLIAAELEWGRHWVGEGKGFSEFHYLQQVSVLAFPQEEWVCVWVCLYARHQPKPFHKGPRLFHLTKLPCNKHY